MTSGRSGAKALGEARRWVRHMGLRSPTEAGLPSERQLSAIEPSTFGRAMVVEKVCRAALRQLRLSDPDYADRVASTQPLKEYLRRLDAVDGQLQQVEAFLDAFGRDLGAPIWGIKGLSARHWYEEKGQRDLGDVDVMVADVATAIEVAHRLQGIGYTFERQELPWLKACVGDGHVYGQFNMKFARLHGMPNIDVHFGGYSVRHCSLNRRLPSNARSGLVPVSMTENLPLIVGNAAGDHRVTTKDLNDLCICLSRAEVDWEDVRDDLARVGIAGFLSTLLSFVRRSAALPPRAARIADELAASTPHERPLPGASFAWTRRWWVTTRHAFAQGAATSLGRALRTGGTAARYYWRPMRLRLVSSNGRQRMPALNEWTCVRLLPLELVERVLAEDDHLPLRPRFAKELDGRRSELCPGLDLFETETGAVVRSKLGDFVPTVFYDVQERHLRSLQAS